MGSRGDKQGTQEQSPRRVLNIPEREPSLKVVDLKTNTLFSQDDFIGTQNFVWWDKSRGRNP